MRKVVLFFASIVGALTIHVANAGTMGPIEQPLTWTGFYLGANAGYGWNHRSSHLRIPHDPGSLSFFLPAIQSGAEVRNVGYRQSGFIGGGQVGYNYQVDQFVGGIEADFEGTSIDDIGKVRRANTLTGFAPWLGSVNVKLDWLGTVRGRVGYAPIEPLLLYATGGYAYGRVKHTYRNAFALTNNFFTSSHKKSRDGYSFGGGAEWMFTSNWSARFEYLYYGLGSSTESTIPGGSNILLVANGTIRAPAIRFRDSGNIVRVGVNYRFS